MKTVITSVFTVILVFLFTPAIAQEAPSSASSMPKISIDFLGGYTFDAAQSSLGFETQGRIGHVIFSIDGKLGKNFTYKAEINPVNETSPLPACGEDGYFFPNNPALNGMGPNVSCNPDGRMRVDDYRFIALDPVHQQGPIRQAYITYSSSNRFLRVRGGRFILPLGFRWDEVGSFTAKDATHIQRINAESEFGVGVGYFRSLFSAEAIVFSGDTRYRDYDYFYFIDGSLDANSGLNTMISGNVTPVRGLDVRAAYKKGFSGSKVERLPNFYASKRNDDAIIVSTRYSPIQYVDVFGEYTRYSWGLMKTSAELLGRSDTAPANKIGYYVGVTGKYPVTKNVIVGTTLTREELSRDDSLVKLFSEDGMYNVELGKKERSLGMRFFVTLYNRVTVGYFRNSVSNPYPWLSGIASVTGPRAYESRGSDKYGLIIRFNHQFN